jgi:flagellar hook protein FlgE
LLAKIDSITGTATPSTISGGVITLHSGTASDLSITSNNSAAFAALGFAGTVMATRGGGGTAGTGQVVGNDNSTFLNETVAGGAVRPTTSRARR